METHTDLGRERHCHGALRYLNMCKRWMSYMWERWASAASLTVPSMAWRCVHVRYPTTLCSWWEVPTWTCRGKKRNITWLFFLCLNKQNQLCVFAYENIQQTPSLDHTRWNFSNHWLIIAGYMTTEGHHGRWSCTLWWVGVLMMRYSHYLTVVKLLNRQYY